MSLIQPNEWVGCKSTNQGGTAECELRPLLLKGRSFTIY